ENRYFGSYADVTVHEEMIADHVRTDAYRAAILRCAAASIRDRVVLDVGAGTGLLSVFCAQREEEGGGGARKVYAVEACSAIAEQAVKIVAQNKVGDRVEVIRGTVETVELPEQPRVEGVVDVIVSEWMGYALLHESMLHSVLFARDKWLKPGGLMLPCGADLYVAPIGDPVVEDRVNFWRTVKDRYGVDMSPMCDFAKECIVDKNHDIVITPVAAEDVLSHPCRVAKLDLRTVTPEQLRSVRGAFSCECFGSAAVNALCVWFTVSFPCGAGGAGDKPLVLSTSPFEPETHWKQAVLYLDSPGDVTQDTKVVGEIHMYPSEESPRHLCIHVECTIGENKKQSKTFSIPDGYSE
ncbi:hypothetical protein NHX12_021631, partial [Muraenolepis orangiensis]